MGVTWSPRERGCSSLSHSVALNLPSRPQGVGQGTSGGSSAEGHLLWTPAFTHALHLAWGPSSLFSCPCLPPKELVSFWPSGPSCLSPWVQAGAYGGFCQFNSSGCIGRGKATGFHLDLSWHPPPQPTASQSPTLGYTFGSRAAQGSGLLGFESQLHPWMAESPSEVLDGGSMISPKSWLTRASRPPCDCPHLQRMLDPQEGTSPWATKAGGGRVVGPSPGPQQVLIKLNRKPHMGGAAHPSIHPLIHSFPNRE